VAIGLLVALAAPWSGRADGGLATPGPAQATLSAHAVYIVQPGDTLWSIAERLDPAGDPRPTMTALSEQAGGDTLRPGERLILP
jgi:nucleoid-associated protein YgaU